MILLLPSALTFITLLIHRIRAARAAQRDRAPEDIVRKLPWHVWTGNGWEKHEGEEPVTDDSPDTLPSDADLEQGIAPESTPQPSDVDDSTNNPSTSRPAKDPALRPWFEAQLECAICLSEFVQGDKVRVLPCHHIFHLDEVDEWLIQRKKLVNHTLLILVIVAHSIHSVPCMQGRRYETLPSLVGSRTTGPYLN